MKKKGSAAGDDSDEDESDTKSLLGRSALGWSDKITITSIEFVSKMIFEIRECLKYYL